MASRKNRRRKRVDNRSRQRRPRAPQPCPEIDWKDVATLRKFMSDRGKIRARRVTGLDEQCQKKVATAVKNAREMALLPYTNR